MYWTYLSGEHCHDQENKDKGLDKRARKKLLLASILCLGFMIGEIVGKFLFGSYSNSVLHATQF